MKRRFAAEGIPVLKGDTHIVPVMMGDAALCLQASQMLLEEYGFYVQPINFPTVARGSERLRFTPSPVHAPRQIDHLVKAMDRLWSHCALNRQEMSA